MGGRRKRVRTASRAPPFLREWNVAVPLEAGGPVCGATPRTLDSSSKGAARADPQWAMCCHARGTRTGHVTSTTRSVG